jgi:hypothetical protein
MNRENIPDGGWCWLHMQIGRLAFGSTADIELAPLVAHSGLIGVAWPIVHPMRPALI